MYKANNDIKKLNLKSFIAKERKREEKDQHIKHTSLF